MTADPRAALTALTAAFERHLEACASRRGEDDPTVLAAADALADSFEAYDDALLSAYGEMTPLEVYGDDDDFDDDEGDGLDDRDDEDDGGQQVYSGLDGDYDVDSDA